MAETGFTKATEAVNQNEMDALTAIAKMGRAGLAQQAGTVQGITTAAGQAAQAIAAPGGAGSDINIPGAQAAQLAARAAALQALYVGDAQGTYADAEQGLLNTEGSARTFYGQARASIPAYEAGAQQTVNRYSAAATERDKARQAALSGEASQREIALANVAAAQAQAQASVASSQMARDQAAQQLAMMRAAGLTGTTSVTKPASWRGRWGV